MREATGAKKLDKVLRKWISLKICGDRYRATHSDTDKIQNTSEKKKKKGTQKKTEASATSTFSDLESLLAKQRYPRDDRSSNKENEEAHELYTWDAIVRHMNWTEEKLRIIMTEDSYVNIEGKNTT